MLKSYLIKGRVEVGCDEAGRGCLAGPVVAAACILPQNFKHKLINDSKILSHEQRLEAREIIKKKAIDYAVGVMDEKEIDRINIHNASYLAMHRALDQLSVIPEHILVDGNRFIPYPNLSHTCIVKGDSKMVAIAAASILAKTYRDELMQGLHGHYPQYGWEHNMGYPTEEHRKAILTHGICEFHRKSFRLYPESKQPTLFDEFQ